jgi:hypothetical protein
MANNVSDAELRRAIAWGRAAFVAIAIVGFVCSSDFPPKKTVRRAARCALTTAPYSGLAYRQCEQAGPRHA